VNMPPRARTSPARRSRSPPPPKTTPPAVVDKGVAQPDQRKQPPPPTFILFASQAASLFYCQWRAVLLGLFELCRLLLVPIALRRTTVDDRCTFLEGTVRHMRFAPARHSFSYSARYCLVDLDDAPGVSSAYGSRQPSAGGRMTASEARALSGCDGKVRALLLPSSAGYEQNPIVVYYCYDKSGALRCCLSEVTNTPWNDRVAFPFAPSGDELPKPLHVSPLQDMQSAWTMKATAPGESMHVSVAVKHPELGAFFVATLDLQAVAPPTDPEWWGLFMAHKVAAWIYWHALLLIVRKGVAFLPHPKSALGAADYRDAVQAKNAANGWSACPLAAPSARGRPIERPIVWYDATDFPWA